jgi:hypothetical protein
MKEVLTAARDYENPGPENQLGVRFWHLADMETSLENVSAFGGKADISDRLADVR